MKVSYVMLLAALALPGCAATSYCAGEHDYQKAESVPPLKAVEGLQLPESASALRIPPPPSNTVAYAETAKDEDGDDVVVCLDKPPALPPPAQPKAEPQAEPKPPEQPG